MDGKGQGQFKPESPITRAEMAVIAARYKQLQLPTQKDSANAFTDIVGHWAIKEIAAVKEAEIVGGFPDQTFRPNEPLTRAQAVKILNRMLERGPLYGVSTPTFADVPTTHWAYNEIEEASLDHHYILRDEGGEQVVFISENNRD